MRNGSVCFVNINVAIGNCSSIKIHQKCLVIGYCSRENGSRPTLGLLAGTGHVIIWCGAWLAVVVPYTVIGSRQSFIHKFDAKWRMFLRGWQDSWSAAVISGRTAPRLRHIGDDHGRRRELLYRVVFRPDGCGRDDGCRSGGGGYRGVTGGTGRSTTVTRRSQHSRLGLVRCQLQL